MARQVIKLLDGVTAVGAGTSYETAEDTFSVQVEGITIATVSIEVSNDPTGTVWQAASSLTADGVASITGPYIKVRANVTAYTSGTISVYAVV